jgi:hypothetical protein
MPAAARNFRLRFREVDARFGDQAGAGPASSRNPLSKAPFVGSDSPHALIR